MSEQGFILAQSKPPIPPPSRSPPRPAQPVPHTDNALPPPPTPQLPPSPSPSPSQTQQPGVIQPQPQPAPNIWILRRDNSEVWLALGLVVIAIVVGYFLRGWAMQWAAKKGADPFRARGFGNALGISLAIVTIVFIVGYLYRAFPVTNFEIAAGVIIVVCLLWMLLTSRSVRRRPA